MELKKNPKADLREKIKTFFQIGMIIILLVSIFSINYKKYDDTGIGVDSLSLLDELDEEVPIAETLVTPPPPPPPPAAPEIIEIVEDEEDIEEDIIESADTDQEEAIEEVEDVEVIEEEVDVTVPFALIEDAPVFPGCEKVKKDKRKDCLSAKIDKFLSKHFDREIAAENDLTGKQVINCMFTFDKKGNIINVMARAKHPALQKEAKRVIAKLPKVTPGKQRNKPVKVTFNKRIIFMVED